MSMPLEGIRVLDWTVWQQGPVAGEMLGDLGAEVIKIEERVGGDPGRGIMRLIGAQTGITGGINYYFENNNRNKKGITVDLRKEKGKEIIYRLVEKSDVFVQNFRHGVAARLGLDYQTLSQYNPKLIYATASGYGPKGPDRAEPAFDFLGLARSGIMTMVGEPDMPPLTIRGGIADQMGAIMLAYAVLAALVARERLGVGQEVDVSHLGSMIWLQSLNVASVLMLKQEPIRACRARAGNPLYNYYLCADNKWIALAHLQPDRQWPDVCKALGIEELINDPRFENMEKRSENCVELVSIFDRIFATKTREKWMKILKETGDIICFGISTISDLVNDPQVIANDYIVDFDHPIAGKLKVVGIPIQFSKTPGAVRLPAPQFGQHTEEVLLDICGYTWDEISEFRDQQVI